MSIATYPSSWEEFVDQFPNFDLLPFSKLASLSGSDWTEQYLHSFAVYVRQSESHIPLLDAHVQAAERRLNGCEELLAGLRKYDGDTIVNSFIPLLFQRAGTLSHFYECLSIVLSRPPLPPPERPVRERKPVKRENFTSSADFDLPSSSPKEQPTSSPPWAPGSQASAGEEAYTDRRKREIVSRQLGIAFLSAVTNWAGPVRARSFPNFTIEEHDFNVTLGDRVNYTAVNDGCLLFWWSERPGSAWAPTRTRVYASVESKRMLRYWSADGEEDEVPELSCSLLAQALSAMIGMVVENMERSGMEPEDLSEYMRTGLALAVHQDWVPFLSATLSPEYLHFLITGEQEPGFDGLCVNSSRGYRLGSIEDRLNAAVDVIALIQYVTSATED